MNIVGLLLAVLIVLALIVMILFVAFGQITVRKLRKNPETIHELGIQFVSGWDILNVAGALAMPRCLNRKFRSSALAAFYADAEVLHKYTNGFDRLLAKLFYSLFVLCGTSVILLGIFDLFGFFD